MPRTDTPLQIKYAQAALAQLQASDPNLAERVKKALPAAAMKLAEKGEEVTVEKLVAMAPQLKIGREKQTAPQLRYEFIRSLLRPATARNTLHDEARLMAMPYAKRKVALALALRALKGHEDDALDIILESMIFAQSRIAVEDVDTMLRIALLNKNHAGFMKLWTFTEVLIEHAPAGEELKKTLQESAAFALLLGDMRALEKIWAQDPALINNIPIETLLDTPEESTAFLIQRRNLTQTEILAALKGKYLTGNRLLRLERHIKDFDAQAWSDTEPNLSHCGLHYLLNQQAKLTFTDTDPQNEYKNAAPLLEKWWHVARRYPPTQNLMFSDPAYFHPDAFYAAIDILQREQPADENDDLNAKAFYASSLFGTEQRLLEYLARWGAPGLLPFYKIIHAIQLPLEKKGDMKLWGDAALQKGPEMAALARYSDRLLTPVKSADGKNWSLTATRKAAAQFVYARSAENPDLAALCFASDVKERYFNIALNLLKRVPQKKNLPDITIDGARFEMEGARFRLLAADDYRGFFLGKLVDNCQSLGYIGLNGTRLGHRASVHGTLSENGGFYVVEKDDKILGASWAWINEKGELCFDSLETLGQRVTTRQWRCALEKYAEKIPAYKHIKRVTVGLDGHRPQEMLPYCFAAAATPALPPKDFGHLSSDSAVQGEVWRLGERPTRTKHIYASVSP